MKRRKGYYSISVVAKMFSVHQQTIRMYEKEGLITPKRSAGNTRLFSEEDVDQLEEIINLTHKMGVNLAGVEIVLKLQKKIKKMQEEMNAQFNVLSGQLDVETNVYKEDVRKQGERLLEIKKQNLEVQGRQKIASAEVIEQKMPEREQKKKRSEEQERSSLSGWKIEYDEK